MHFAVAMLPAISRFTEGEPGGPWLSFLAFFGCGAFMPAMVTWLAITWAVLAARNRRLIGFVIADFAILVLHFIAALPEAQ
jgi:hypothetical protein